MSLLKLIPILTFLFPALLFGQVIEEKASMSEGVQNAFVIELEGADRKMAENVWKEYIGQFGKTKRDRKSKEWRSPAIILPAIDDDYNINLTGKFEDLRGNSRIYAWVKMDGNFINSDEFTNEARGMKDFLEEYSLEVRKAVIGKEVEEEQKRLNGLEKDLNKLVKKNEGFHRDIDKANEAIVKAEKNIEQNVIDQENKRIEIEEQKAALLKVQERLMAVGKKD